MFNDIDSIFEDVSLNTSHIANSAQNRAIALIALSKAKSLRRPETFAKIRDGEIQKRRINLHNSN